MKVSTIFSLLLTLAVMVGCASNKPKNSPDSLASDGMNDGMSLELNGDSDSRTAGGLSTVYFGYNSAQLNSSTMEALKNNAEFLKSNNSVDIQVEGHCDERGSSQYNLALGERRAKSVRDYLVARGIESSRINTISYGKERPVAEGNSEDAWSKNRRANFVITAK